MSDAELKRWQGLYDRELERAVKAEQEVMAANMRMVRLERELAVARTCAADWRDFAVDMGTDPESDDLPWEVSRGVPPYARPEAPRVASRSAVAQGGQRPAELRMVSQDRRAIAKWIRGTSCVWSDDIQDLLCDLAGQIERGEHERWDQADGAAPNLLADAKRRAARLNDSVDTDATAEVRAALGLPAPNNDGELLGETPCKPVFVRRDDLAAAIDLIEQDHQDNCTVENPAPPEWRDRLARLRAARDAKHTAQERHEAAVNSVMFRDDSWLPEEKDTEEKSNG